MIRPEAQGQIARWREALLGVAVTALGLWGVVATHGYIPWLSGVLALLGAAITFAGIQRARFRNDAGGVGVVKVDEGQIAYFGPFTGGAVALTEIHRLTLETATNPPSWRLAQHGQPDLLIPLDAEGADALFDVFAALPGLRTQKLVGEVQRAAASEAPHPVVIWDRARLRLH
ncbi:hypothetical protein SAMN06297129_1830 [Pseudooceanicola antarcticus]|uniref:PH domain-containing protein n=1 Tax=Pseudooceanicola antarcticus TaxID=1247613 RepID=A0A285IR36_9RHOB|nr:hypothetical protein [Pseudooceanicola antarcticus]PJE31802.1 hypothetical protein CVM39_01480 [Pseudooceanicola antarcticus]SNY50424.1 hypothetical protein SAMN06297129_1830 [Pseudooceanicola antarcticus]